MYFNLMRTLIRETAAAQCMDANSGEVLGVINKVFVKSTKETLLQDPSGITYAIPIQHAKELLRKKGIQGWKLIS